jgi:hypothetical protein
MKPARIFFPFQPFVQLLFFALAACSGKKELEMVPKNAKAVVVVDFKNLALNALSMKNLMNIFQSEGEKSSEKTNSEPNPGIDVMGKGVMFQLEEKQIGTKFYFILPLSNKEEFVRFVQKWDSSAKTTRSFELDWLRGKNFEIGIDDHQAIGVFDVNLTSESKHQTFLMELKSQKEENRLLAGNPQFKELAEKSFDAAFWVDMEKQMETLSSVAVLGSTPVPKGDFLMYLNFDDGKVALSGDYINRSKELEPYYRMMHEDVDTKYLNLIPNEHPLGVMAFRMDPKVVKEIWEKNESLAQSKVMVEAFGLSVPQLMDALGEHFVFSALDARMDKAHYPIMALYMEYSSKEKVAAILSSLVQKGILADAGNETYKLNMLPMASLKVKDKVLEISNVEGPATTRFDPDKFKDFPSGNSLLYINTKDLLAGLNPSLLQSEPAKLGKEYFSSISMTSRYINDQRSYFDLVLNTTRPDENALMTMMNLSEKIQKMPKENDALPQGPGSVKGENPDM